ncbi:MAG TPA: helix-hairpin-helix domain-containing protein [Vicinamibacterales bacterium]|nr:helix-hairpin-helix domain-containing protein [Vicinamibacterales bacterium]
MNRFVLALAAVLLSLETGSLVAQHAARPPAVMSTAVINLNSASAVQIADLPGIGVKTAELIVQYRAKNGPFKKIEEVMNVRGIGEKSFLRIKERITVADRTDTVSKK